jgi:hypothetical protein
MSVIFKIIKSLSKFYYSMCLSNICTYSSTRNERVTWDIKYKFCCEVQDLVEIFFVEVYMY